ncbi:putative Nuclear/nucleolar GTPase 2 [Paratrimastix pyriformis]|uniref:Nucleolar GTP-binding protein 2 n=1 Tax=Paratrimastix pyriformis TaxID=342808 RepID=A0ABQ8UL22_9EUKA|nr:putative Nuclear/nucleolar GTPase 2 [Paratrimastix pyriformis]
MSSADNPLRPKPAHVDRARSKQKIEHLNMINQRPKRSPSGKMIYQEFQSKKAECGRRAMIAPDRSHFENSGVIGQEQMQKLRRDFANIQSNPFSVLVKPSRIPLGLIREEPKDKKMHLLSAESFSNTFGPQAHRKRPRINLSFTQKGGLLEGPQADAAAATAAAATAAAETGAGDSLLAGFITAVKSRSGEYSLGADSNVPKEEEKKLHHHSMFEKGQSRRIWGELYKVVDSSDVIAQVLDVRDPRGTRCPQVEEYVKKNCPHKHIILVLNKCDLVPTWATARWVQVLSKEYPTVAFHASINNPFGKGALIQLLRQFVRLHSDKKNISVGFIGYPNVGKSSVINSVMHRKVCKVAPEPGETKVWQYISLMARIYLIDCPGIVQPGPNDTDSDLVLKGVVRVANLLDAAEHIPKLLERAKPEYLRRLYHVDRWTDATDFLSQFARGMGRLLKGGEPDLNTAAKVMLYDWQRGKIPYFELPALLPGMKEDAPAVTVPGVPVPVGAKPTPHAKRESKKDAKKDAQAPAPEAEAEAEGEAKEGAAEEGLEAGTVQVAPQNFDDIRVRGLSRHLLQGADGQVVVEEAAPGAGPEEEEEEDQSENDGVDEEAAREAAPKDLPAPAKEEAEEEEAPKEAAEEEQKPAGRPTKRSRKLEKKAKKTAQKKAAAPAAEPKEDGKPKEEAKEEAPATATAPAPAPAAARGRKTAAATIGKKRAAREEAAPVAAAPEAPAEAAKPAPAKKGSKSPARSTSAAPEEGRKRARRQSPEAPASPVTVAAETQPAAAPETQPAAAPETQPAAAPEKKAKQPKAKKQPKAAAPAPQPAATTPEKKTKKAKAAPAVSPAPAPAPAPATPEKKAKAAKKPAAKSPAAATPEKKQQRRGAKSPKSPAAEQQAAPSPAGRRGGKRKETPEGRKPRAPKAVSEFG